MDVILQIRDARNILDMLAGPERIIKDRINPFEFFREEEFTRRFRFSKENVIFIVDLIYNDICPKVNRYYAIPPHLQVLISMQFYATGAFQISIGDLVRVHQATVCRVVKRVSVALARKKHRFVNFPIRENLNEVMGHFFDIAGIPSVLGAIDCTHVKISNPGGEDPVRFVNRKGFYSINCQYTCDANLAFTSVVCRWPGSTHDARIFRESVLSRNLERDTGNGQNGFLLGDAGYPLLPFLMTPVNNVTTPEQRRYNFAHSQTRGTIERAFGILKRRFACMHFGLRLKLQTVYAVIVAVTVLHNFAIARNENLHLLEEIPQEEVNEVQIMQEAPNRLAQQVRQQVIMQFA